MYIGFFKQCHYFVSVLFFPVHILCEVFLTRLTSSTDLRNMLYEFKEKIPGY